MNDITAGLQYERAKAKARSEGNKLTKFQEVYSKYTPVVDLLKTDLFKEFLKSFEEYFMMVRNEECKAIDIRQMDLDSPDAIAAYKLLVAKYSAYEEMFKQIQELSEHAQKYVHRKE